MFYLFHRARKEALRITGVKVPTSTATNIKELLQKEMTTEDN